MTRPDDIVIRTYGLSKSFGEVQALKSVDLSVPRNSIFGFLGPNGAGKTTLMKVLLGLSKPTRGGGSIFGYEITKDSIAIRERVGYLPQQPRFIEYMTARENLLFAAKFFFSGPEAIIRERCDEMLELVGIQDKADRPIQGFSGGEKQRLGIALAQVNYPDLLILDEPASALDPLGRRDVLELMEKLRKYTTIFYSTHILDDVQRVSDTVAILNRGELLACGPIEQILNSKDGMEYILTIKGNIEQTKNRLSSLAWISHITITQLNGMSIWQIKVKDEMSAETYLLRHVLADEQISVLEFSRKRYELEEVFLDIIEGVDNGI